MLVVSRKKTDYIIKYVMNRLDRNQNFVSFFSGETGSGKTYSALRFAEKLDPDFTIDNVVFDPKSFMNLLNGEPKQLKKGSVILWEEIQTSMGHMDFQSFISKAINYVLTTFRHKNYILLITAPYFSFINASTRKLFHAVFEMQKINYKKKVGICKPLFLQINQRTGKTYFKYLQVARGDGSTPQIKSYSLGLPSKELLKQYEKRKTEFTTELNRSLLEEIEQRDNKNQINLTGKQKETIDLLEKGLSPEEISKEMGVVPRVIYQRMESIRKKGFELIKHTKKGAKGVFYEVRPPK